MIAIDVHRTGTEYVVTRTTRGRSAPEWISCRSLEELRAVLVMLGVAEWRVRDIFDQLADFADAEVMV